MKNRIKAFFAKEGTKSVLSSLLCIAAGIFVGWLVLLALALFSDKIPVSHAFKGLGIILAGPFASGGSKNIAFVLGDMLFEAAPLMLTGLSVAIAFKTGLFNIGAPGQYLMGAMSSVIVALAIPTTPATAFWVWLLALLVGMISGMLWGMIPGFFKAFLGVNEVIVCIMTNWIAANVVSWVFYNNKQFINAAGGKSAYTLPTTANGVSTPKLGLDKLFPGSNIDIGIFIAIAIAILIFILLNKTTLGYELKACGHNKNAAKYAGMNEKRNIVLSMALAGGLAALGASLYFLNGGAELAWNTYGKLPDTGFNGIPVALLASNNPLGVIFGSGFLRYIDKGGYNLAGFTAYNEYVSDLIIAVIIYFAGFSKLIKDLLSRRKAAKAEKADVAIKADDATQAGKEEDGK
ncbi:MAG: ABC transporter permease [Clostridia bacterium]|nr:ABC transporter permease [Clostridia bacterium]MBR2447329.1 ABC transporter permease [Clostridia bacterium]